MILKPLFFVAGLSLLTCLSSTQGWAATYYVASGVPTTLNATVPGAGQDNRNKDLNGTVTAATDNDRGSINYPFRTIQYAALQAQPGDTVIVRNGTYAENVALGYDVWDALRRWLVRCGDQPAVCRARNRGNSKLPSAKHKPLSL